jgi:hypothetical protein
MHTENEFIDNGDDLLKLLKKIKTAKYDDYETKLILSDGSWISISASCEDGELFIKRVRKI